MEKIMFKIFIYCIIVVVGILIFKYIKGKSNGSNSETLTVDGVKYNEYDDC